MRIHCFIFYFAFSLLFISLAQSPAQTGESDYYEEEAVIPTETDANAQKIIDRHIKMMGGPEGLNSVTSLRIEGILKSRKDEHEVVLHQVAPGKSRLEYTLKLRYGQRAQVVVATNGEVAWALDESIEDAKPMRLPKVAADDWNRQSWFYGPIVDGLKHGGVYTYEGKGDVKGRPVYMLKAYFPGKIEEWIYIDQKNFLILMYSTMTTFAGARMLVDNTYLGYQKVEGTYIPTKTEESVKGSILGGFEVTRLEPNIAVDEAMFNFPAEKPEFWLKQEN